MTRLKDTYYTSQLLDGIPVEDGGKKLSPTFAQGEDVHISFYLNYNGIPVDPEKHDLQVIIKKTPYAENKLWTAVYGDGLFKVENIPGFFYILMPSKVSSLFIPGTYYMDVLLKEKIATGTLVKDKSVVILKSTISIELSTISPNPKLSSKQQIENVSNPEDYDFVTWKITSVEPTLP